MGPEDGLPPGLRSKKGTYAAYRPLFPTPPEEGSLRVRIKRAAAPISAVVLALLMSYLLASVVSDSSRSHLMAGAVVSALCCLLVIASYVRFQPWRRHPAPLIFYRSIADLVVALRYIVSVAAQFEETAGDDAACRWISGVTQLGFLSAESWFAMISLDLLFSLTNPFTSYKANLKIYHAFAWGTGILTAAALTSVPSAYGVGVDGFCWTTTERPGAAWSMLFAWLVVYYMCAVGVLLFGYRRLHRGMKSTYWTRMRVLKVGMFCVAAYALYWSVVLVMYFTLVYKDVGRNTFDFVLASKGAVNLLVWVVFHDLREIGTLQSRDVDIDLSPQLNLALRGEMLFYTTQGIREAVLAAGERITPQRVVPMQLCKGDGRPGTVKFLDYVPHVFSALRQLFDISDEEYLASLSHQANEVLSEGASGSFLFFSGDRKYVVKSITDGERRFLLSIVDRYHAYIKRHAQCSLLTRFCGLHSISMYRQTFTFVVMTNVLATRRPINARYDIKGSWVDRNAKPSPPGRPSVCRHCNENFIVGASGSLCPGFIRHEPDMILKDNDLTHRIQLRGDAAVAIIEALRDDSDFLCGVGVMDYSLLIGVHLMEFPVDPELLQQQAEASAAPAWRPRTAGGPTPAVQPSPARGGDFRGRARSVASTASREGSEDTDGRSFVATIDWRGGHAPPRHPHDDQRSNLMRERNAIPSRVVVGPGFYYLGVIDMLQTWNWRKRVERFVKVWLQGKAADGVSAVPPREYADRFQAKISNIIEHQIFVREIRDSPALSARSGEAAGAGMPALEI